MPDNHFKKLSVFYVVFLFVVVFILSPASAPADNINIFIVGDSTACNYNSSLYPRMGWGQVFNQFVGSNVAVFNYAISGRSSKSYWDEGSFAAFVDDIQQGDYLFIQFGHNDEKSADPTRYTQPYTTYQAYLSKYIDQCSQRGGHPVLLTPVNRRSFNSDGTLRETHGEYPAAMIALGREKNVPVIDITQKSKVLFESYGVEGTKDLFLILSAGESANYPYGVEDNTHFQKNGAMQVAKLVVEGIEENNLPLLDTSTEEQTCRNWTTTNNQHVAAGRAYTETGTGGGCNEGGGCESASTTYYAVGSDQYLGISGIATTTLRTEDGGQSYQQGSCSGASTPDSITHEAEEAVIGNGVIESEHSGYSGSGYVNFANETGSYVEWTVNTSSAGNCDVTFRYANGSQASRPMNIVVNGATQISGQSFNSTSAWTTWVEQTVSIYLNSGSNTIRAVSAESEGGPNVDKIVVTGNVIQ